MLPNPTTSTSKKITSLLALLFLVFFYFSFQIPKINIPKVIECEKEIVIKGMVKKTQEKFEIILKQSGGKITLKETTENITVYKIEIKEKFDFLSHINIGYEYKDKIHIAYSPVQIKISKLTLTAGVFTNLKTVGADIGIRYKNLSGNVGYTLKKDITLSITAYIF